MRHDILKISKIQISHQKLIRYLVQGFDKNLSSLVILHRCFFLLSNLDENLISFKPVFR